MNQDNSNQINLSTLRDLMKKTHSATELHGLCMDLDIDYENIPGEEISRKIIGLINYLKHRNRLQELVSLLKNNRPNTNWGIIFEPVQNINTKKLSEIINLNFSESEIRAFALLFEITDSELIGASQEEKIHALLKIIQDQGSLQLVVDLLKDQREVDLSGIYGKPRNRWIYGTIALILISVTVGMFLFARTGLRCTYHEENDHETITQIIKAESQAVIGENLEIIEVIFDPNAYLKQTESDGTIREWFDPMSRYASLFEEAKFIEAMHFGIKGMVTGNRAQFTSGGKGSLIIDGQLWTYENDPDNPQEQEDWTLKRDFWGCWQITKLEFH